MNEMNPITGNNIYWEQKEARKKARTEKAKNRKDMLFNNKSELEKIKNKHKQNIGKTGKINIESFIIKVKILDFKQSFGNFRYLVEPLSGSGTQWVEKITVDN